MDNHRESKVMFKGNISYNIACDIYIYAYVYVNICRGINVESIGEYSV